MAERRRRGEELEAAILEAALDVLQDKGYSALTYEAVASRAATSRSVIYRRWASREDLMIAAIQRVGLAEPVPLPDTGSLREDLIEILVESSRARAGLAVTFMLQLAPYYLETGRTPSGLRSVLLGQRALGIERLVERAEARGEIRPGRLTARLRALPGDLMRAEMMLSFAALSRESVEQIVDEIVLPLWTQ